MKIEKGSVVITEIPYFESITAQQADGRAEILLREAGDEPRMYHHATAQTYRAILEHYGAMIPTTDPARDARVAKRRAEDARG